jgi:intron-binding protein aquarius
VDPRHLLRLGSGEADLREILATNSPNSTDIFSKQGRVNWCLARRLELLTRVQRLGLSLHAPGDVGYSCETAEYFELSISGILDEYQERLIKQPEIPLMEIFPFLEYFSYLPSPLFTGEWSSKFHLFCILCVISL